jgi:hypothetical protein
MSARRFVVQQAADGRWTFGREDAAFQIFDSKEAALSAAERFLREHPDPAASDPSAGPPSMQPTTAQPRLVMAELPSAGGSAGTHDSRNDEPAASESERSAANGRKDVVWERRLRVRQTKDGLWVFGPEDKPIGTFAARDEAVLAATKLVMKRPEIELVVEDAPRAARRRTRGRQADG